MQHDKAKQVTPPGCIFMAAVLFNGNVEPWASVNVSFPTRESPP
jgi:hypothetical protein